MNKIRLLPQELVARIAAGEVIERPVFAVKELVENALDAGARSIIVHLEEYGLKRITVIDTGEGMSSEDLQESFKSHTTSKLSSSDELSNIQTMGFRGEALASIAAVSTLTIKTRDSENPIGMSITLKHGKLIKNVPIGMPCGTEVIVDHLFHNLPVRKKFLKSQRTELRYIIDLITGFSLAYPSIQFVLQHNKRTLIDLSVHVDQLIRIQKLLGKDIYNSLVPVTYNDSYISIQGYLAKPNITTSSQNKQFLYINNRLITDKNIASAIKQAYGSLLAQAVNPVYILHISLPYEIVDVNVHPRKEYVRFADTKLIIHAVTQAVKQTLDSYDLIPYTPINSLFLQDAVGSTDSYAGKLLKEKILLKEKPVIADYTQIIQLQSVYLLLLTNHGIMLFDQHAAHERILYEQIVSEFVVERNKQNIFRFPKPGIFELSLSESELLLEYIGTFTQLGWEIEHFKQTTFVIRSLPVLFQDRDYVRLLQEMLLEMKENKVQKDIDEISKRMIAYLACHASIKAGDKLSKKQMKEIIMQLEKTQNNATCPHGRPTRILLATERINQLFKRT